MGIDADFKFSIPTDADFPDDVLLERDPGETRQYLHPGILHAAEDKLSTALAALSELVCLKDLKDKHGKTDKYLSSQPEAWLRARMVLKAENYERVNPLQKGGNDNGR